MFPNIKKNKKKEVPCHVLLFLNFFNIEIKNSNKGIKKNKNET
jgi:hypothetical protein